MTSYIFKDWLENLDRKMRVQGRKILKLVDNCTAHPSDVELTNIELYFLPKNTTSLIQPMDQGIIKNLKGHYRSKLCSRLIAELDLDTTRQMKDLVKSINLLDCLHLLSESWSSVKTETIANCFRHGGFKRTDQANIEEEMPDILGDVEIPESMTREEFNDHVSLDDDAEVTGISTYDAQLLAPGAA